MKKLECRSVVRPAHFLPESAHPETRTIEVVWSTGARVLRTPWFAEPFYEELSLDDAHVSLKRLNAGAPVLNAHKASDLANQIGVVERAWLEGGKGHALVRFSERPEISSLVTDVLTGIVRNLSVGYEVKKYEERKETGRAHPILMAVDWEPVEISFVPVPADGGAQTRGAETASRSPALERVEEKIEHPGEPSPPPPLADEVKTAVEAERKRSAEITELVTRTGLERTLADEMIAAGTTIDEVRTKVINAIADRAAKDKTTNRVRIEATDIDERQMRREAIEDAIMHRRFPGRKLSDHGSQYRGMTLIEMARSLLESTGVRLSGMTRQDLATRAFHATSDFPAILANVANKALLEGYSRLVAQQTFTPLVRITSASDFKPMTRVRFGEMPLLSKVEEGAKVEAGTIGEGSEVYQIATYARIFAITRQAIINDDLGAFTDLPQRWGEAAARLESDLVWAVFTESPKMSDGKPLFHRDHSNVSAQGTELSVDSLSQAEVAMSMQQGIDGHDKLNVIPRFLIVPPQLKTAARKLLKSTTPAKSDEVNPFQGELAYISEPRLSPPDPRAAIPWYLAASRDDGVDLIEVAYLDGIRQPRVEVQEGFDTFGIQIRASLDLGVKTIDYRGLFRNGGKAIV